MNLPICVDDFEAYARIKLPKNAYDYYKSGADEEHTLARNRASFNRILLLPRVLRDVSHRDWSVSLLNGSVHMKFPIGIAPTASQKMAHDDGEVATAKAAASLGTVMICSSVSTCSLEEIAQAAQTSQLFFQLYFFKDRSITQDLVTRAEKAGYKALVLTVDTPFSGKRRNDIRNKFILPSYLKYATRPNYKSYNVC